MSWVLMLILLTLGMNEVDLHTLSTSQCEKIRSVVEDATASLEGDFEIEEVGLCIKQSQPEETTTRVIWDDLADCESGNWIDGGRAFEEGSARWYWARPGTEVPPWGTTIHHGGLQFHPDTWSWVAPMVVLGHIEFAYDATREEQIKVAEKVLELQGWGAWPTCAGLLGLR